MGYGYYVIGGKERGYLVDDICNKEDCRVAIDRGLAYVCGGSPYEEEDSCANYFCAKHMFFTARGQRCETCAALVPEDGDYGKAWLDHLEAVTTKEEQWKSSQPKPASPPTK